MKVVKAYSNRPETEMFASVLMNAEPMKRFRISETICGVCCIFR